MLDVTGSGQMDLVLMASGEQAIHVLHRKSDGSFEDVDAVAAGLKVAGRAVACAVGDYDADGLNDLAVALDHGVRLFRNLGNGKFQDVTATVGATFGVPAVARGAAYGDIYNDGALDLLVSTNGGPVHLFRNSGATNNSLRIKLVGTRSNRDGIGTVVRVAAGSDIQ